MEKQPASVSTFASQTSLNRPKLAKEFPPNYNRAICANRYEAIYEHYCIMATCGDMRAFV